jgi:hypothetical protein
VAAYENYCQEGRAMSPREIKLGEFIELTDAEILEIWENLKDDQNLIDFARACIAASFKQ